MGAFYYCGAMSCFTLLASLTERIPAWWSALDWDVQLFYAVGGIALLVVIIQALLTLIGIGDIDADLPEEMAPDADISHDAGLGLISVRTLTAFFMGFGLTGGVMLENAHAFSWAIGIAALVGFVFMVIIFWIMKMLYGLRASGNINPASAKGMTGTVYVAIPSDRLSGGQVELLVSGRLMTLPAITAAAEKIPAGTLVRVVEVLPSNVLLVERA